MKMKRRYYELMLKHHRGDKFTQDEMSFILIEARKMGLITDSTCVPWIPREFLTVVELED